MIELLAQNLSKFYTHNKFIFKNIDFELKSPITFGIAGRNGSGKTTLLKLIAGVLSTSSGKISLKIDGSEIPNHLFYKNMAFIAPYLSLYEEFTPLEHLKIFSKIRSEIYESSKIEELLELTKLTPNKNQRIAEFSSGMKQRFRYISAFVGDAPLILADEAFTNLDLDGIEVVKQLFKLHIEKGRLLILASNEPAELALSDSILDLNKK